MVLLHMSKYNIHRVYSSLVSKVTFQPLLLKVFYQPPNKIEMFLLLVFELNGDYDTLIKETTVDWKNSLLDFST